MEFRFTEKEQAIFDERTSYYRSPGWGIGSFQALQHHCANMVVEVAFGDGNYHLEKVAEQLEL